MSQPATRHDPVPYTVVLARNEKGKPTVIEHRCAIEGCDRLISNGRHV